MGQLIAELGSSRGRQLKVLWYVRQEDDTYVEELHDIVKPSATLVDKAELVHVPGSNGHYRLREEDEEAALSALAERWMRGLNCCMADELKEDDNGQ